MKTLIVLLTAAFMILTGCKKSLTGSTPDGGLEVVGSYVGWGHPGGTGQNTLLEIALNDSGSWLGSIKYGGLKSDIAITEVSQDEDSIRFQYIRGDTYRLLGVLSNVAITLYVVEPSGQPTFSLNQENGGFNLSGEWHGQMYSQWLEDQSTALMYMDQQGAFYDGNVQTNYSLYTLQGIIDAGAMESNNFYFGGTTTGTFGGLEFRFDGSYVIQDSIAGTWYVTGNDLGDQGTFSFWRRF